MLVLGSWFVQMLRHYEIFLLLMSINKFTKKNNQGFRKMTFQKKKKMKINGIF